MFIGSSDTDLHNCEDVSECEAVENIIKILSNYHHWNREQLISNNEIDNDWSKLCNISQNHTSHKLTKKPSFRGNKTDNKILNICSHLMDNNNYNVTSLLDDFHHCYLKHCQWNGREYEYIFNELTTVNAIKSQLNASNNILHRHNYNSHVLYCDIDLIKKVFYGYDEPKSIIEFTILDQIYCYFIHCYDLGLRIKCNDLLELEQTERKLKEIEDKSDEAPEINIDRTFGKIYEKLSFLKLKINKFQSLKDRFDSKQSRYVINVNNDNNNNIHNNSNMTGGDDNDNDEKNDEKKESNNETTSKKKGNIDKRTLERIVNVQGKSNEALERDAYKLSVRWHYTKNASNCADIDAINGQRVCDWFVITKHVNIKREMLDNKLHALSMNEWIYTYSFASELVLCYRAKTSIRNIGDRWKSFYTNDQAFGDANTANLITIDHILSILFYSNFRELTHSFLKTYSFPYSKHDHSEFANFGRLVRDTVEDFGDCMSTSKNACFYFGVCGQELVLHTTMIRFCSPISSSSSLSVITQYVNSDYVIECKEYSKYLRFFNSFWISLHGASENENVFSGGDWPMKMHSILDFQMSCNNYQYYIVAMNIIQDLVRGEYNHECEYIDERIKHAFNQIISSRLWMRDAIPKYIDDMFTCYCDNMGEMIEINCEYLHIDVRGYIEIKSSIIDMQENDRIKFDVLCSVFPNITILKFLSYKLVPETFQYLLQFLMDDKSCDCKLKYVIFTSPNQTVLKCKTVVKNYKKKFEKINWHCQFKKKDHFGQPILIIAKNKIKMDDCIIQ